MSNFMEQLNALGEQAWLEFGEPKNDASQHLRSALMQGAREVLSRALSRLEAAEAALKEIATTTNPDWAMRKMARAALEKKA